MHGIDPKDGARSIDWGRASPDYAVHRPGYPDSFWERLRALGVGLSGQRILDLGTGTGVLSRRFAAMGCNVTGVDIAAGQVEAARELARAQGLEIDLRVGPAEETGLPSAAFDRITASQCWLYFDPDRMIEEVRRLLASGGRLMTCHLSWLPRLDDVARRTEELVLRHNPDWTAADWSGEVPEVPSWTAGQLRIVDRFCYDEPMPFTRETWRGRIRACRGVGANLSVDAVAAFDRDHLELLERTVPETFTVQHRIDAHLMEPL